MLFRSLYCFGDFLVVMKLIMKKAILRCLLKPGNLEVAIKLCHRLFGQSGPVHYNQDIGEHLRFEGPLIICHHVTSRGHCDGLYYSKILNLC